MCTVWHPKLSNIIEIWGFHVLAQTTIFKISVLEIYQCAQFLVQVPNLYAYYLVLFWKNYENYILDVCSCQKRRFWLICCEF